MLLFESRLVQVQHACGPTEFPENEEKVFELQAFQKFILNLRLLGGLAKEAVFCNLRIPDQFEKSKEEISVVVLTGKGIFCLDLRNWKGRVSLQDNCWLLEMPENTKLIKNTSVKQVADPVQRIKQGFTSWITNTFTPHWLSGHLSFRHITDLTRALGKIGTWDILDLHGGQRLIGDYRGCLHIALNREEADELEFSYPRNLTVGYLWALVGYSPQVTVKMYKRGGRGWLWRPVSSTVVIPYNTHIAFRVCGEDADAKIPANNIDRIILSI
ncbi:uncharacterized protein [Chiloscyllium punctatum]|uniref:uncharacterized protein isoform X3 n=1 Tax=Chiloscyllium punctatum TaxID=137246 RepID=UPI003B63C373